VLKLATGSRATPDADSDLEDSLIDEDVSKPFVDWVD